jgi:precorrin-3B methylase
MANAKKKEEGAEGILETVEDNFRKSYAGRLKKARDLQRQAEVRADAEALRASASMEDAERQIAEIRRGSAVNLLEICGSAAAGLALGIAAQKMMDVRVHGVPVNGVLGLAGVGLGAALEEDFPVRAVFAVGGAMFTAGTLAYAYLNPPPSDPAPSET